MKPSLRWQRATLLLALLTPASVVGNTEAVTALAHPAAPSFVSAMVESHGFERGALEMILRQVELRPTVIARMQKPAEAKPWHAYRTIFVTDERIAQGARFWDEHQATLERARAQFGVPPEIVVAILGVETFYGRHMGRDPVLASLATLAFDYPPRAGFFRRELEEFFLLAREEQLSPANTLGSYAGAMGYAQFIPSSYRRLAIDFNGDRRRDLLTSVVDAIGSIANYLEASGWRRSWSVAAPVQVTGEAHRVLLEKGMKPNVAVADLEAYGVLVTAPITAKRAALIRLQGAKGPEYWVGLENFYAITRYNHSSLYAMAVHQLGKAIRSRRSQAPDCCADERGK